MAELTVERQEPVPIPACLAIETGSLTVLGLVAMLVMCQGHTLDSTYPCLLSANFVFMETQKGHYRSDSPGEPEHNQRMRKGFFELSGGKMFWSLHGFLLCRL